MTVGSMGNVGHVVKALQVGAWVVMMGERAQESIVALAGRELETVVR